MVSTPQPIALLLAASTTDRWLSEMLDDTFAGVHALGWFDWLILGPYFAALAILSIYGLHRFEMLRAYFKAKPKLPKEAPERFEELPRVTIQLPMYNERYVVERLLEETVKMDYPRHLLQIQVLDDSTDDTHPFTEALCARYRAMGHPVDYIHRTNRHGYKAGALEEGTLVATGEFLAIFDADFLPPADFLQKTIHFFKDPKVGMVQTRWAHINRHYNLLTEVQAMLLDAHFVIEHPARFGHDLFFNFNGTAGILRKEMIRDAGGWQHDTLTEDSDLSYRAQLKGWQFVYLPHVECPSELPVDTYGFQVQQQRWSKGLTQCAKKLLERILRADLPWRVKFEAFCHLTPNISYPLMILVSALMLPVMICRFYMGWLEMLLIDLPLIIASFWSISLFYVIAQKELFPNNWKRSIALLPLLMAAGVALTVSNTKAVMEALLGVQTAFARTPKFNISGSQKIRLDKVKYRRKSGWLPYIELAVGTYFLGMVFYAIRTLNVLSVPFLLLFVCGYYWAGITTLHEEWQGKLKFEKARQLEASTRA